MHSKCIAGRNVASCVSHPVPPHSSKRGGEMLGQELERTVHEIYTLLQCSSFHFFSITPIRTQYVPDHEIISAQDASGSEILAASLDKDSKAIFLIVEAARAAFDSDSDCSMMFHAGPHPIFDRDAPMHPCDFFLEMTEAVCVRSMT